MSPLNLLCRHVGLKTSSEGPGVILKMISTCRSQSSWEAPLWLICSPLGWLYQVRSLSQYPSCPNRLLEKQGCLKCRALCRSESYLVTGPGSGTSSELGMSRGVLCVPWPAGHLVLEQQHPRHKGPSPFPCSLSWLC